MVITDPMNEPPLIMNGVIPGAADTLQLVLSDLTVCKAQGSNASITYDPNVTPFHHIFFADPLPKQGGPTPKTLCEDKAHGGFAIDEEGADRPSFAQNDVPNIQKADGAGGSVNEGQTVLTNGRQVGFRQGRPIEGPNGPGALAPNSETYIVKQ